MYEQFFDLQERPFDLNPNPRFLVWTEAHREVLMNLEYGISSRKGVTLVIGEPGSGKTTLVRAVLQRQPERVHHVHLTNPTLSRQEFVETLAARFGLSAAAGQSKAVMLAELEALLADRRARGEFSVLIVDEAQSAPAEILEEIRLLANIEADDQKLLSVILAGQPELAARLDQVDLRQLRQRVALRCELRPLTLRETTAYIAGRIAAAGGGGAQVFTQQAVALIHEASRGLPRTISVIADNALLGGFAAGEKPVTSQTVRNVCRDFGFLPGRGAASPEPDSIPVPAAPVRTSPADSSIFNLRKSASAEPEPEEVAPAVEGTESDEHAAAAPASSKRWRPFLSKRPTRLFDER